MNLFKLSLLALLLLSACYVNAAGVSPYLPINSNTILENEIERLGVSAGIPDLTKPYNLATVVHYLEKVKRSHPILYRRLKHALKPYLASLTLSHAKLELSHGDNAKVRPNGRGYTTKDNATLSLRANWQAADWLGVYLGAEISEELKQPSGSMLSMGTDWAQLDIGYKDYWLSPFQGSAQLLSTNAETLPSFSLSNNLPIKFYGRAFNYEVFLAQLSKQPVLFNDVYSNNKGPLLSGFHLSFQPTPWWTLGATRIFQFGGGERDLNAKTIIKAFFDPRGADNDAAVDEESGNQIASISSRIYFDGRLPFSFNLELAGEDTSNNKAYQLGNTALTVGLYFPYFLADNISLTYEYASWQNGWYTNNVYQQGFTNEGNILGHWAMQAQHDSGTAAPGKSHFLKSHWQTSWQHLVSVSIRGAEHQSHQYDDYWDIDIDYSFPVNEHLFSVGAYFGKDNFGESFAELSISAQWN
jgi:hypothetical protein